jgi:nucleoside-diphosphate-sugar epimerase
MGVIDPLNSRNCYPESKRLAEAILESGYGQYGTEFNVLRIAHTYGPGMSIVNDGRVMADFMDCVISGRDIVLNSDGSAIRGFCYVTDTIRGILDVLTRGEPCAAYNLANEREAMMIRDVAAMLIEANGDPALHVSYKEADAETKKGYLGYKISRLDTSRIEGLGWYPHVTLADGLRRTVSYFREEQKGM